jgi:hypothetical protein
MKLFRKHPIIASVVGLILAYGILTAILYMRRPLFHNQFAMAEPGPPILSWLGPYPNFTKEGDIVYFDSRLNLLLWIRGDEDGGPPTKDFPRLSPVSLNEVRLTVWDDTHSIRPPGNRLIVVRPHKAELKIPIAPADAEIFRECVPWFSNEARYDRVKSILDRLTPGVNMEK